MPEVLEHTMKWIVVTVVGLTLMGLAGCGRGPSGVPANGYRIAVQKISKSNVISLYQFTIETSSRRKLVLLKSGGRTEMTIGPDPMSNEKVGLTNVTLVVTLADPVSKGQEKQLTVYAIVETKSG